MADVAMPTDAAEMDAHLTADAPDGHGLTTSEMSMADMTAAHDAAHVSGAQHTHAGMDQARSEADEAAALPALPGSDVTVRDLAKRELDVRILPWNTVINTAEGTEEFRRGAFDGIDPQKVLLMGLEHEAHFGVGQGGQPVLTRHPVGKGTTYADMADGPHMTFRVANTQRGDEVLALAAEGIVTGVSPEFRQVDGGTLIQSRNGRRHKVHVRSDLAGLSTTYRPAYGAQAAVLAVRSEASEGEPEMATETPVAASPEPEPDHAAQAMTAQGVTLEQLRSLATTNELLTDRLERLETRSRQEITFPVTPQAEARRAKSRTGEWVSMALKLMTGERVSDIQVRTLADLITSDNVGVVPDSVVQSELIGIIDPARPFLETTRHLPTPDSGLTLTVPVIVTRPTVGVQATEKADIVSTATSITTTGFDAVTVAGGGDISLQLLKRSSPSYLDLYLQLLAEAYAINSDVLAIATLLDSGTTDGTGYIDPENLLIGEAWTNAVSVSRLLRPDRMWMSTDAIQAFIDAKASGTNAPLYSNLAADITVGNGAQGLISGLRPVYVPGMDGSGADVIIGPSRGFAWAEDGTFTLQVDVPSKAGKDIAIVGIDWFAPLYPAAFTTYRLAS